MYKQFLKSILLATVATFSLSTVVSAKPIPKNATQNQIIEGLKERAYTSKDIDAALKKGQTNVMGFVAYHEFTGYKQGSEGSSIDKSYSYAKKAAAKNDTLGKFTLGMLYVEGHKQKNGLGKVESKQEGVQLVKQACLEDRLLEKFRYSVEIMGVCSFMAKEYKK